MKFFIYFFEWLCRIKVFRGIFFGPLLSPQPWKCPHSDQICRKFYTQSATLPTPITGCPKSCTLYKCYFECIVTRARIKKCMAQNLNSNGFILDRKTDFSSNLLHIKFCCNKLLEKWPLLVPKIIYKVDCSFRLIYFSIRVDKPSKLHGYIVLWVGHWMMDRLIVC